MRWVGQSSGDPEHRPKDLSEDCRKVFVCDKRSLRVKQGWMLGRGDTGVTPSWHWVPGWGAVIHSPNYSFPNLGPSL